jgi:hypothetical protein
MYLYFQYESKLLYPFLGSASDLCVRNKIEPWRSRLAAFLVVVIRNTRVVILVVIRNKGRYQDGFGIFPMQFRPVHHKEVGQRIQQLARQRERFHATIGFAKDDTRLVHSNDTVKESGETNRQAGAGAVAENQVRCEFSDEPQAVPLGLQSGENTTEIGLSHFARPWNIVDCNDIDIDIITNTTP